MEGTPEKGVSKMHLRMGKQEVGRRMKWKMSPAVRMVFCALLWSTGGILFKWIPWNPFVIAGFRSLLAGCTALIYMKLTKTPVRLNRSSWVAAGFMMLAFFGVVGANKLTTAANAVVLQYTQPIFIMLISVIFFGQKAKRSDFIAVAGVFLGIALSFVDQLEAGNIWGNVIAVLAGAFLAGMFLSMEKAGKEEKLTATVLGHFMTAAVGVPLMFVYETSFTPVSVAAILAAGIFQMGIAYLLFISAVDGVSALSCSIIGAIEPILNPVWVFLLDGEAPGPLALAGGLIVIFSITLWSLYKDGRKKTEKL